MKVMRRLTPCIPVLLALSGIAYSQQPTPPPEAYKACEGKVTGDPAQLAGSRGETVNGICREEGGKLFLQPDRPKGKSDGRRGATPPPEAYKACEGKRSGDTSQLVGPRGGSISGKCEELNGKLVLRPDMLNRKPDVKSGGPPPDAYKACEGKVAGNMSQFVGAKGETVTGKCEQLDGKLVLRPDMLNGKPDVKSGGPPPDAYKACEGKAAGDLSQFVAAKGETVSGKCEQLEGKLVLEPDGTKTNH